MMTEEELCYDALRGRRWPEGVRCPWCGGNHVTMHTRSRAPRLRYLCLACRRTFTDRTGTIFACSKVPLSAWFLALSLLPRQLSTVDYARILGLSWETASRISRSLLVEAARPGLIRDLSEAVAGMPLLSASLGAIREGRQ